jgi:hypothetical protein
VPPRARTDTRREESLRNVRRVGKGLAREGAFAQKGAEQRAIERQAPPRKTDAAAKRRPAAAKRDCARVRRVRRNWGSKRRVEGGKKKSCAGTKR